MSTRSLRTGTTHSQPPARSPAAQSRAASGTNHPRWSWATDRHQIPTNPSAPKRPSHTVSECLLRTATGRAGRACGWPSVASASRGHSAARTPRCSYPAPPHRAALYAYGHPPTHRSTPIRSLRQSANTRLAPDCSAPESSPVPRTRTPAPAARCDHQRQIGLARQGRQIGRRQPCPRCTWVHVRARARAYVCVVRAC
jgi:hypothetical protein